MNRGVMQSSPVQQITAAGNPNWWNINTMLPPSHHFPPPVPTTTNYNFLPPQSPFPFSPPSWPLLDNDYNAHLTNLQHPTPPTDFWTQLFMGGMATEEEKAAAVAAAAAAGLINHFPVNHQDLEDVKQHHHSSCGFVYGNNNLMVNSAAATPATTTTSSPQSCITTFSSSNLLEISPTTAAKSDPPPPSLAVVDPTHECNSTAGNGGSLKKAKVQSTATQSTFKVRKFGDRITALHQLVSPFGKTDTASVLLEAIGYVRFLQSQIEALSLPYLSSGSGNNKRQLQQHPQSVQGERKCIFPAHEDPGQLLNGSTCLKRKGGPDQEEPRKDLMSRGLCLVPVSWTLHVGRDNGADYWAPVLGGFQ